MYEGEVTVFCVVIDGVREFVGVGVQEFADVVVGEGGLNDEVGDIEELGEIVEESLDDKVGDVEELGDKVVVVGGLSDVVVDVGELDDEIVVEDSLGGEVSGVDELGGKVVEGGRLDNEVSELDGRIVERLDGEIGGVVGFVNFGVDVGPIEDS